MPSPFSNGVQNADKIFDLFAEGKVVAGKVSGTSASAAVAITHGLGTTPDFVLIGGGKGGAIITTGATKVTITRGGTGIETIGYLIGVLA